jgi:hypothetical protein
MKEERSLLQGATGKAQPKEESKTKKYIRLAVGYVGLGLIVWLFVMATLRRCEG